MSGSKPKLKVRTLDEMLKKISESSENDPEQLAHTSENSPVLSLSETDSGPVESESSQTGATKSDLKLYASATLWQYREKCPEVIKTYINRCASLILCNTCMSSYPGDGSGRKLSHNGCTAGNFDLSDHGFLLLTCSTGPNGGPNNQIP
jgi:hypothetical protein